MVLVSDIGLKFHLHYIDTKLTMMSYFTGKSTIMNMLASSLTPEHGQISLGGVPLTENDTSADHLYSQGSISYCAQFDALFAKKTVNEHIRFYSDVRGLDWKSDTTRNHLESIIQLLGLTKHREKQSTELSGGYKRRLCLAIALIGHPKVLLLDECTTGLDPAARHLVWNVLKPESRNDSYDIPAILLSSHYMDECQHLGTRIGIMIDGELVATGSLNRLRELYCTGLFVEIALQSKLVMDCKKAEQQVIAAFAKIDMEASIYETLPFHFKLKVNFQQGVIIGNNTTQLAEAFRLLETNKIELAIQFYSISLMNLEQIFIDLSRKQFKASDDEW